MPRLFAAVGDSDMACCARLPHSAICFLRAVSQETFLPPFRLAGFLRHLPSSCSLLPGTGSYPGQQRDDFTYALPSLFAAMSAPQVFMRCTHQRIVFGQSASLRVIKTCQPQL